MRSSTISPTSTQTQALIDHFNHVGSVSGLEALALYRIVSLTKVISVLKRRGLQIVGEWKADNTGKRYKRYTMIKPEVQRYNDSPRTMGMSSALVH